MADELRDEALIVHTRFNGCLTFYKQVNGLIFFAAQLLNGQFVETVETY